MANLDVVPKRRMAAWVWIVLAIVIVAVLWLMLGRSSSPQTGSRVRPAAPAAAAAIRPSTGLAA